MKSSKEKKIKRPMTTGRKILLGIIGVAAVVVVIYLLYYLFHYVMYDKYEDYLSSYEYETGSEYQPISESSPDVRGMDLVAENEYLKLYTDTDTTYIAVYDKRDGSITYSNPLNADEDTVANNSNIGYMKAAFLLTYYNSDVKAGTYDSYTHSVARGQFSVESIEDGVRYLYRVGDLKNTDGADGISFDIPLEYRLVGDGLEVSIPASGINEYGNGSVARIQLLRYMGASTYDDNGYMVVPNGSGSLIYFNNGKTTAANYSQYIYDIDPLAANYTTIENIDSAKLSLFGICREDRSLLVTVEDGASTAMLTAGVSGVYNDLNYAYPTFVLRNTDNLYMFGGTDRDIYILEADFYDINIRVRYTFLNEEYAGYDGLANYYRERLIAEGKLTPSESTTGDIPFYYDVVGAGKETEHFLGVQYYHTFPITTYDQAGQMADQLAESGVTNQVMNFQGWSNGGYYHDTADKIKGLGKLGGKSDFEALNDKLAEYGGRLYADVAFQQVSYVAEEHGYNYQTENSRYYAGYVAAFGRVNPATLRNTSVMGYMERGYNVLSPKYLPRYVGKFASKIVKYDVDGISLRDLGNYLASDKRRTEVISREEALDIVLGQLTLLEETGKNLMTSAANDYAFAYSTDIINVSLDDNTFAIVDETIPLYEMIIHGSISYSSQLLNYEDAEDKTELVLNMIEAGASPHYVFTWLASSELKNTGLNDFYATTFETWKDDAVAMYEQVNEALKHVSGALITGHEILENGVRKVTYSNGVTIYINYENEVQTADGFEIPATGYRMEGI